MVGDQVTWNFLIAATNSDNYSSPFAYLDAVLLKPSLEYGTPLETTAGLGHTVLALCVTLRDC